MNKKLKVGSSKQWLIAKNFFKLLQSFNVQAKQKLNNFWIRFSALFKMYSQRNNNFQLIYWQPKMTFFHKNLMSMTYQ